jgi:two-component system chemotaxis response regulator CheB
VLRWSSTSGDDTRLRERVRVLRRATVVRHPRASLRSGRARPVNARTSRSRQPIVGMAASTGGPHTLVEVVRGLVDIAAPVLIVQHMHPEFVGGFVDWIRRASGEPVVIAEDGMAPEPGTFYIAPAGFHLKVDAALLLALDAEPATLHRPSANELFLSMAESLGVDAVGVLLTGMGDDGASGLLALHRAGGKTIVQDGATSAIDGMPRAARELGAAGLVAPLNAIPKAVRAALGARK